MSRPDDEHGEVVVTLEVGGDEVEEHADALLEALLDAQEARERRERDAAERREAERIHGVVLGRLVATIDAGPRVTYPRCPSPGGVVARSAASLTDADVGRRVALMFEGGEPARPMLIGPIELDDEPAEVEHPALKGLVISENDQRIDIRCKKAIGLSVGKASIIVTPSGKILVRGKDLVSRASSVNRIRGATVKIN